jgi:glycosyltransferase-like protein
MRIAILTHSTNPRGGVVHALELAAALSRLGHRPVVHAPDQTGAGFFRDTIFPTVSVPAARTTGNLFDRVEARILDYVRHFTDPAQRDFDLFHAQDGISGNALVTLKERGLIEGFARTVHHIDRFDDPRLEALQARSILKADRHFTVSRLVRGQLQDRFGVPARIVGNGVDTRRYSAIPDGREGVLRRRLGLGTGPVFLAVGGVEERKNINRALEAFQCVHALHPGAQLVIAGGASLLDHGAYRRRFDELLCAGNLPVDAVVRTGPIPEADMPALFRLADALLFPSVREGFGLAVVEAMASGTPVVTSRIEPFTEYLGADDVAWCDPLDVSSIADAMTQVLAEPRRSRLIARGREVADRHDWLDTAKAHLAVYETLLEPIHA